MKTVVFLIVLTAPLIGAVDQERQLQDTLFANYNKAIRPPADIIHVSVYLRSFALLYMEQQEENMVFAGEFEMKWTDSSLTWNPQKYQGLRHIHPYENTIWRPEVTVYNSVGQDSVIDDDRRLVTLTNEGEVQISNPSIYTVRCKLDISKFPFDRQRCKVKFSSWVYTEDELALSAPSEQVDLSNGGYQGNSEWEVTSITVKTVITTDPDGKKFQELHYSIELKRHSAYYVYVLFLPTFITAALCLIGLFTPFNNVGDRSERTTLGLTTLLSLAVILNIIGDDMPKSSTLPQLAKYVLAEILLCCAGVLVTVILLVAHQRVLTRQFLPPSRMAKEEWNRSEEVCTEIERLRTREDFRLHWTKIFDAIDLVFLVLFQIINFILSLCYLTIR
ncbi:Neurotransmitter-gated ion-channel ligand binding domain protein [Ancylostoma caninum]|uniref:Neurotransmitter-gated ion-channel ligand binding domain protein n=1 Tax=Ancylostoma caninum TaxID=29170 RepID=A0A368H8R2_ANCCA|nr:Neurotransmitter-gated ion-channel ligand binding domain protein [Ancylostoma caninum]